MSKLDESLYKRQERVGIGFLVKDCWRIRGGINRKVQLFWISLGKSKVCFQAPLHRCPGTSSKIAAFFGREIQIAHADFITIVKEGNTGHCENEGVEETKLFIIQIVARTNCVVIACD